LNRAGPTPATLTTDGKGVATGTKNSTGSASVSPKYVYILIIIWFWDIILTVNFVDRSSASSEYQVGFLSILGGIAGLFML
jgi:hypothetical protein